MSNLTAFKFANTLVVAGESVEEAYKVLASDPDYQDFSVSEGRACTEAELDEPQKCTWSLPAKTIRERLAGATKPAFLQSYDG